MTMSTIDAFTVFNRGAAPENARSHKPRAACARWDSASERQENLSRIERGTDAGRHNDRTDQLRVANNSFSWGLSHHGF
jgi:hypothetical protein